jgi:hypothetical protein
VRPQRWARARGHVRFGRGHVGSGVVPLHSLIIEDTRVTVDHVKRQLVVVDKHDDSFVLLARVESMPPLFLFFFGRGDELPYTWAFEPVRALRLRKILEQRGWSVERDDDILDEWSATDRS